MNDLAINFYSEMTLVKVVENDGKTIFYAVTKETANDMEEGSAAMTHIVGKNADDYNSLQFKVEILGNILVEK